MPYLHITSVIQTVCTTYDYDADINDEKRVPNLMVKNYTLIIYQNFRKISYLMIKFKLISVTVRYL